MHMYTKKGRGSVCLFLKTNGIYYKQAGACKALEKSMYFPVLAEQKTKSSANISIDAKKKCDKIIHPSNYKTQLIKTAEFLQPGKGHVQGT